MSEEEIKMSLYIIEDDGCNVLTNECYFDNTMVYARLYDEPSEPEHDVEEFGGHVVTLTEEPEKIVVSEEEAEMLETAKNPTFRPSSVITSYSSCHGGWDLTSDLEDRLMRAYVNGYTVAKEKKYNVKVLKKWSGDDKHYWSKEQDGSLTWAFLINKDYMIPIQQFTLAEIEHYGLQDCEKEEVTDDEQ